MKIHRGFRTGACFLVPLIALGVVSAAQHEPAAKFEAGTATATTTNVDSAGALTVGWITPELLAQTQQVWSKAYERPIDPAEATEILLNVKRLAKLLMALNSEAR